MINFSKFCSPTSIIDICWSHHLMSTSPDQRGFQIFATFRISIIRNYLCVIQLFLCFALYTTFSRSDFRKVEMLVRHLFAVYDFKSDYQEVSTEKSQCIFSFKQIINQSHLSLIPYDKENNQLVMSLCFRKYPTAQYKLEHFQVLQ